MQINPETSDKIQLFIFKLHYPAVDFTFCISLLSKAFIQSMVGIFFKQITGKN